MSYESIMLVTYQTDSFLDKNRDYVVVEHCNLLSSSKCSFISRLFPSSQEEPSRSSYKFSSVASRFKQQLQALMETLNTTEPHYVRCVKPNSLSCPQQFDNLSVLHQLRCGGVLEAIRISLAGYPTRRTYSEFLDRFGILALDLLDGRFDEKALTGRIIQKLKLENFQLGKTKVFLRAGQIGLLDSRRSELLDKAARLVQGHFRTFFAQKEFIKTRMSAITLQAYLRGCFVRTIYAVKREAVAAILLQKYIRRWLLRHAFLRLFSAALLIQSSIRGSSVRQRFMCIIKHRAAVHIQAKWRMWKACKVFQQSKRAAISTQCAWRRKLAKRELRRLKAAASEAGALREEKNKLEKSLEDISLRLTLERRQRAAIEESNAVEVSKLQKTCESLNVELGAAKLAIVTERERNASLESLLELTRKGEATLQDSVNEMEELRKDNLCLKSSLESLTKRNMEMEQELSNSQKRNMEMEQELLNARKSSHDTSDKLQNVETKYLQLQQSLQNLEEKLSTLEDENQNMKQKALNISPLNSLGGITRPYFENHYVTSVLPAISQKPVFEIPSPTKSLSHSYTLADFRRPRMTIERHEDYQELLLRCIKEDLGFKDDKPVAACIIYKCLLHWHSFEAERTAIFDYIIETINGVLKVDNENDTFPYWLSNASTLLCLLQRNLRSNGYPTTPPRRSVGSFNARMAQSLKYPSKLIGTDELSHVDARYPAMLFKQQLTACLEKIFGLIRDNLKKEISPLLSLCIQAPKLSRGSSGRRSKSPEVASQQPPSNHWDRIIKFLDSLMVRLRKNHVPAFFIRKLITQVFSFINIQLFNSLLLRRECCTFSNGEYMKSGLAVLEKWIADATEEFSGSSWNELHYIRQAVGFLVIHQKRRKSLEEIRKDLCPALSVRQIYRICTMYWDDKYSTQSVSTEVVATIRDMVNKDTQNPVSNSFLLDDDLSIPFSTEDISKAIPVIDPTDVEPPSFLRQFPAAMFLAHPEPQPA